MTDVSTLRSSRRATFARTAAMAALLCFAFRSHAGDAQEPDQHKSETRKQLSIGYSLLYQEADGIPKFKWILMLKDKSEDMKRMTDELVSYYRRLADDMQGLAKQYPAMRIDVAATSDIEADTRKAIGEDLAKDMAPLVGQSGKKFEREALLMFDNSLNEQRHLTEVMMKRETVPGLKKFLETTKAQLDERFAKVEALLNRRYFTPDAGKP